MSLILAGGCSLTELASHSAIFRVLAGYFYIKRGESGASPPPHISDYRADMDKEGAEGKSLALLVVEDE